MASSKDIDSQTTTSFNTLNPAISRLDGNLGVKSLDGNISMPEYLKGKNSVVEENRRNLQAAVRAIGSIHEDDPNTAKDQIQRRVRIEEAPLAEIYEKNKNKPPGSKVDISKLVGSNVKIATETGNLNLPQQVTADIEVVRDMLNEFRKNAAAVLEEKFPSAAPNKPSLEKPTKGGR